MPRTSAVSAEFVRAGSPTVDAAIPSNLPTPHELTHDGLTGMVLYTGIPIEVETAAG